MYVAWARCSATTSINWCATRPTTPHADRSLRRDQSAEFFAVATETFFEKPRQLQSKHPELYLQLQQFYSQNPAALGSR